MKEGEGGFAGFDKDGEGGGDVGGRGGGEVFEDLVDRGEVEEGEVLGEQVVAFGFVVAEGGGGGEGEAGELRVDEGWEDGDFGDHRELEGESDAVVEEDVGDSGMRDIRVDPGEAIC